MCVNNKVIQNIILFLFFIFPLIKTLPNFEESLEKKWNEHTLFDYIKQKFLGPDKLADLKNMHYMLVDPDDNLKKINLEKAKNNLELLYKEFNITSFIFIVNGIEKNTDLDYKLKDFVTEVFSEIYKYNNEFDIYSTISVIFQIEDKKMNIRLGSTCRGIVYDFDALKILKKRDKELKDKKIEKLLNEFTKDFLSTYRKNYKISKNNNSSFIFKKGIIFILIFVFIIILSTVIYFCFCYKSNINKIMNKEDIEVVIKSNRENKIKEFIKKYKNKNIEKIMEDTCIICLEDFEKDNNDIKNSVITSNSDEEDTNNNESISNEKITIPCEHSFHIACISECFNKEKRCPICHAEFEFFKKEEKNNDDNKNKLNIKNFTLNKNWEYNDKNSLINNINNFMRIQKIMNPLDINDEFCSNIISLYENTKNDKYEIAKIDN